MKTNQEEKNYWFKFFTSPLPKETIKKLAGEMEPYLDNKISWKIFKSTLKPKAAKERKKHREFYITK